jgi:hypothetical protein
LFCTQCGAPNPEDARFCHRCGRAITRDTDLEPRWAATRPANLEAPTVTVPTIETRTPAPRGVKGWLLLLCLSLTIFWPLITLGQFAREWQETERLFRSLPHLENAVEIEGLMMFLLACYSCYAGYALWSMEHPDPVGVAKSFFLTFLAYSVVSPFMFAWLAELPEVGTNEILKEGLKSGAGAIVQFGIWFSYLRFSKRVRATYATPESHISCPDCRQLLLKESQQCEHCGCKLVPQSS